MPDTGRPRPGGQVLPDVALAGEWQAQWVHVGAPTPALWLVGRGAGGPSRVYLFDPASGAPLLVPWQAEPEAQPWRWQRVQGREPLRREEMHLPVRPHAGGPGLVVQVRPDDVALKLAGWDEAAGHRIEYLYTYDHAARQLRPMRLQARPPLRRPMPRDAADLVRLILRSLTLRLPETAAGYFADPAAGAAFAASAPNLPLDAGVTRVELGPPVRGRVPFGAALDDERGLVRGWVEPDASAGGLARAAAITGVRYGGPGIDLDGDGDLEWIEFGAGGIWRELKIRDSGGRILLRLEYAGRAVPIWADSSFLVLLVSGVGGSDGAPHWAFRHDPAAGELRPLPWRGRFHYRFDPERQYLWGTDFTPALAEDGVHVHFRFHSHHNRYYHALYRYQDGAMVELRGHFDDVPYPEHPLNLIHTVFEAAAFRLPEELERYFADPAGARRFYTTLPAADRYVVNVEGETEAEVPLNRPARFTARADGGIHLTGNIILTRVDGRVKVQAIDLHRNPAE